MALSGKTLIMAGSILNVSILKGFMVPKGLPFTVIYSRRLDILICRIKESEKMRKLTWNTGFQPSGRLKIITNSVIFIIWNNCDLKKTISKDSALSLLLIIVLISFINSNWDPHCQAFKQAPNIIGSYCSCKVGLPRLPSFSPARRHQAQMIVYAPQHSRLSTGFMFVSVAHVEGAQVGNAHTVDLCHSLRIQQIPDL